MRKKTEKIIAILLALVSIIGVFPNVKANAEDGSIESRQWGEVVCPGIQVCYGCSSTKCDVYSVQQYNVFYTYDECKTIVANGSKISIWTGYASLVYGIKPIAATWLALYSMSVSDNLQMFRNAVAKETGIELRSEYVISKSSYSLNQYMKGTLAYKNKDGWNLIENKWYYYENGYIVRGWKSVSGEWYYLDPLSGVMKTGWQYIDNAWYYLWEGGSMAKGWVESSGAWYYLDRTYGYMRTGWQSIDNCWYYFYSSGAMATNTVIDGWKIGANGVATKL